MILDSEIAMTSKSIFADWRDIESHQNYSEDSMCLTEKGKEICYRYRFSGFLFDCYGTIYS